MKYENATEQNDSRISRPIGFLAPIAIVLSLGLMTAGCDVDEGPVEESAEAVDEAVEETGDAIEEAADEAEDATDG